MADAPDVVALGGAFVVASFKAIANARVQMAVSATRRRFGAIVVRPTEWARRQFRGSVAVTYAHTSDATVTPQATQIHGKSDSLTWILAADAYVQPSAVSTAAAR